MPWCGRARNAKVVTVTQAERVFVILRRSNSAARKPSLTPILLLSAPDYPLGEKTEATSSEFITGCSTWLSVEERRLISSAVM